MDISSLYEIPFNFIKENLNGWIILVFICILIYFIILRNYYMKREQFFDQSMQLKNMQDIEETEEDLNDENDYADVNMNNTNNKESKESKKLDIKVETKENKIKNKKNKGENNTVIAGTNVFEGLDNVDDATDNIDDDNNIEGFDGFESPTTTSYASVAKPSTPITSKPNASISPTSSTQLQTIITTTLFDNLQINDAQIKLCKSNYTLVINTYITELLKLVNLKKNNKYLNVKKQFDVIIGRGVDNIINYLSNTIKSPIILTRTSIKTDVLNSLSNNLEVLINNTSNDITKYANDLAAMNSTTIDYNSMLSNINNSRTLLENYIEIDKLVANYGKDISNYNNEINNTLNKSFVLPIYERNFDKITQLVKSDFNENENNLANKYGQAYTDFLNEKKKDELDINPMRLASKIESGIVDMLTNLVNGDNKKKDSENIIEQSNPDPNQVYNNSNNNSSNNSSNNRNSDNSNTNNINTINTSLNNNANIYNDKGNLGNYLVDKKTQKQVLEGFVEDSTTTTNSNTTSTIEPNTTQYESKKKKKNNNKDIISNLMSGDFLQYIMDIVNEKIGYIMGIYSNKYGTSETGNTDNKFNIEENMIPAGFLLFILSMLIYFIDTTS